MTSDTLSSSQHSDNGQGAASLNPAATVLNVRTTLWVALALALVGTAAFQGTRGLYETTEGRYAECARETLHAGDLTEPMLNGKHHWTKPPLTYAAIAAGLVVFGENTLGARAYLVAAFVLTVLALYLTGAQLWDRRSAAVAALVYASSPFPLAAANMVSTDTLLVLWHALAFLFYWLARRRKRAAYICLMWLMVGAGCLTKGPLGILPLFSILPFHFLMHRREPDQPLLLHPVGLVLVGVVGLGWYLWKSYKYPGLMQYWFMHETVGRLAYGEFDRNPEFYMGVVIYVPTLALGAAQWAALFFRKRRTIPWPRGQWLRPLNWANGPQWTFLLLSFVLPFLFFMVSRSRLALYVLPLFVPMALAMGRGISWLMDTGNARPRTLFWLAAGGVALFAAIKPIPYDDFVGNNSDMKHLAAGLRPVLERYPQHKLYAFKKLPLYGLPFYLHEPVPAVTLEDSARIFAEARDAVKIPLVLLPGKDLKKLAASGLIFHIERVTGQWWVLTMAAS